MTRMNRREVLHYSLAILIISILIAFTNSLIGRQITVDAGGEDTSGTANHYCTITATGGSGTQQYRSFRMDVHWVSPAPYRKVQLPAQGFPYTLNVDGRNYGANFSVGWHQVRGEYGYIPKTSPQTNNVKEFDCYRSFNVDNTQAIAWVDNISCNAGALTFNASVSDGNGGTPGYYLSIQNVGDTGWIYRPNGTYGHGPWGVAQDGGTYSISIWAADAQTGGVVGPGVYYYSCPAPPPPTPPTCTLSVNPSLVPPNTASTLSWTSSNATSFTVDQGVGALSPVASGSRSVNPGQTSKTYTGSVTGPGGSANCSTTLTVGSVGCTLNSITTIEPGDTYTPSVTVSYVGPAASVSANITVIVNGTSSTYAIPATAVPGDISLTVSTAPPITFATAGDYPVTTKTVSGTVNGVAYGPTTCSGATLVPVVLKPYFKVFNGGVTVGAGFNNGTTTCAPPADPLVGRVSAFASNSTGFLRGASTQYDLKALRSVATTFYSSVANPGGLPNFKALTFANNPSSGAYGGSFGGSSCITDYYSTTKIEGIGSIPGGMSNINAIDNHARTNDGQDQIESIGDRTIIGGTLAAGEDLAIYITGNVYITGDITLATNYTAVSDIPFFALVVKGNIMIDPGVLRLDGLYIAQPRDDGTGGGVYTCATSATTIPASTALYGTCNNKLTFNGSVVAKNIKLLRTFRTLRDAPANETVTSAPNSAAEVFNGMPELFLANPAFKVEDSSLYDSINSLPPLL